MVRVLLLGGSSFVGSAVRSMPGWPHGAMWTYRSGSFDEPGAVQLDLSDGDEVRRVIAEIAPTHVLDCALPMRESPHEAVNTARVVCDAIRSVSPGARYLYVSSDAVFSGEAGRLYLESDPPDPDSEYGRAKAGAEGAVMGMLENSCVARTCLVYGQDYRKSPPGDDPRLSDAIRQMRRGEPVYAYAEQYRTPTFLEDLALALLKLLYADLTGIFHLAGPVRCSRAGFVRETAEAFGLDPGLVLDQPLPDNPRFGRDTSLSIERARDLLGWNPHAPKEGLARLAMQATAHHA